MTDERPTALRGPSVERQSVAGADVVAASISLVGPLLRSMAEQRSIRSLVVVGVVGVVTAWRLGRTDDRSYVTRWAIAVAAGAFVALVVAGSWVGVLLALGLLVGDSVARSRGLVPGLPGATLIARAVGRAVAAPVRTLSFGLLAVPLVVGPWAVGRVLRIDPLWRPVGWADRRGDRADATRPWSSRDVPRPLAPKLRIGAAVVLVGAVVAGLRFWPDDTDQDPPIPAAFADASWYPTYRADSNWVQYSTTQNPLATVRIKDVRTRTINVIDGKRVTWSPPACGCRRLRVWFYGGSTAFGLGQRDEHTIASELARAAWADDIALDVENRGVGGDTQWEEAQRFAWDLTAEEPPDMVVFYDGTNEMIAASHNLTAAPSVIRAEFWQKYVERVPFTATDPPPGASPVPTSEPGPTTLDAFGRAVARRYDSSRRLSRVAADHAGVVTAYFWQPTADLRGDVAGEPPIVGVDYSRKRTAATRAALPADVIDIADVFDGVTEPLYYDTLHTNERGAKLVAAAIYSGIRPQLDRLLEGAPNP